MVAVIIYLISFTFGYFRVSNVNNQQFHFLVCYLKPTRQNRNEFIETWKKNFNQPPFPHLPPGRSSNAQKG